ncbi:MAG: hypothetical protein ACXV8O_01550 [Methylobacter sp.]
MNISQHQIELLNHTLGLRPDIREPYRNHFVAGPGHHDQADLESLEKLGLMQRVKAPSFCPDGDVVFICTDSGKNYAIDNLPRPGRYTKDGYLPGIIGEWRRTKKEAKANYKAALKGIKQ